jgi:hypothetical protein
MELAIPLIALGGMYIVSNNDNNINSDEQIESFINNGRVTSVTNNEIPINYPNVTNEELQNTTSQGYYDSNQRTDKYFSNDVNKNKDLNKKYSNNVQFESLTGEMMNNDNLKHNNMVPYFGAKIRGRSANLDSHESTLDNMIGTGSQMIKKTEQAPLFKPEDNVDFAHGAPNMSDFYQSRVNASNKMANVKPWEEQRVGPGLNQGFTTSGAHGYNAGLEARDYYKPKNVDELRVKTNPKESFSLSNHQGPALSKIKKIGQVGRIEKNKPDTYYENSQNRWFTTTGLEKAQTARVEHLNKDVNRGDCENFYEGTARSDVRKGAAPTVYQPSNRCEYKDNIYYVKNKIGGGEARLGDYGKISYKNKNTNRDNCSNPYGEYGGIKASIGALFAPLMDAFRTTKKEDFVNHARTFGNSQVTAPSTYVNNPSDAPNVTNREMYGENYYTNVQNQGLSNVNASQHQSVSNQRDTTNIAYVGTGGGSGVSNAQTNYGSAYNQKTNEFKEQTMVNRINGGNDKKYNTNMNVTINKNDNDRNNNRMFAPSTTPIFIPPSTETMGHMDKPQPECSTINSERIDPALLNAFKSNPYTQSIHSIA